MKYGDVPAGISVVVGACAFFVLQDRLVAAWFELYPGGGLPSLVDAARAGLLEAWLADAPSPVRASQLGRVKLSTPAFGFEAFRIGVVVALGTTARMLVQEAHHVARGLVDR